YLEGEVEKAYPQQQTLEETAEEQASVEGGHETDGGNHAPAAGTETDQQALIEAGESPECPECGSMSLYYSEGCKTCEACGWSEC
ncbi:MAG: ribonucleoside-diphosphate reductase alpha chain, partial [Natrialbaceae archaeon]